MALHYRYPQFCIRIRFNPMQLAAKHESKMIRRNTNMRSLFVEYARPEQTHVVASLQDRGQSDTRFNLTVVTANENGIELKLPVSLSGMYDLLIRDGKLHFSQRIAIQ